MKKILILGGSLLQLPAIIKSKELGLLTIVADYDPNAIGRKVADKFYLNSTLDIQGISRIAIEEKVDAIITMASDRPMITVSSVSEKLGLKSVPVNTVKNTINKFNMRNILLENNVPIPKFKIINIDNYVAENLLGQELIIKPINNSGSRGVSYLSEKATIKDIQNAVIHAADHTDSGTVLIEEYMRGPEVTLETFSINGKCNIIAVTDKLVTPAPYFVELGHSQPTSLSETVLKDVIKLTKSAIKTLKLEDGPAHVEIIVTNEGPKIVEVGPRLGGDHIGSKLTMLSTGIDLVEKTILQALGKKINIENSYGMSSAIRYFTAAEGRITSIHNVSDANKITGVEEINFLKNIGDQVTPLKSSNDRIGYVIASGTTKEDAINTCLEVLNLINIVVV